MGRMRSSRARVRASLVALLTVGLLAAPVAPAMADGGITLRDRSDRVMARLVWQSSAVSVVKRGKPDVQRQLVLTASDERLDEHVVCVKVEMRLAGDNGWRLLQRQCAKREPKGLRIKQRLRWDQRLDCHVKVTVTGLHRRENKERSASSTSRCSTA